MGSFDARRWASALVESAGDDADAAVAVLERWSAQIESAGDSFLLPGGQACDARLEAAFAPVVADASPGQRAAVGLLRLLARRHRLSRVGEVAAAARDLRDARRGVVRVLAETAAPLDEPLRERLRAALSRRADGGDVELTERVDPALIGGVRLTIGSERVDGSIRKRFQQMAAALGVAPEGENHA